MASLWGKRAESRRIFIRQFAERLRSCFADIVQQPLPARLQALLDQIGHKR